MREAASSLHKQLDGHADSHLPKRTRALALYGRPAGLLCRPYGTRSIQAPRRLPFAPARSRTAMAVRLPSGALVRRAWPASTAYVRTTICTSDSAATAAPAP